MSIEHMNKQVEQAVLISSSNENNLVKIALSNSRHAVMDTLACPYADAIHETSLKK